jgi:hypothetical protein
MPEAHVESGAQGAFTFHTLALCLAWRRGRLASAKRRASKKGYSFEEEERVWLKRTNGPSPWFRPSNQEMADITSLVRGYFARRGLTVKDLKPGRFDSGDNYELQEVIVVVA